MTAGVLIAGGSLLDRLTLTAMLRDSASPESAQRHQGGLFRLICKVLYHDHCFDGACSASLFTRFHRECIEPDAKYRYQGLVHRAGGLFEASDFSGDENAIVDFKYASDERVTWWFDHHLSAFLSGTDEADFERYEEQVRAGTIARAQKFFDPSYISCTSFIAHIASTRFGMDVAPLQELLHWADIVDGARYESAASAVGMGAAAMKLTLVIESSGDETIIPRLIPLLTAMPLEEVLAQPFVQEQLGPLLTRHWAALELIRERARVEGGVITFDITDQPTEGYSKFIPYFLHPEGTYVVGLSKSSFRTKVSVGTNPWTPKPASELVNLAAVCERYGGGGHARVGAISFPPDREDEARAAAAEIAVELRAAGSRPSPRLFAAKSSKDCS